MKDAARRLLRLPGCVEALLALAVLWLYHSLLSSPVAGWAEFLYPLGASWGYRDWSGLGAMFTPDYWTAFRYGKGDWVPATFAYFFLVRRLIGATPAAVNAGALLLLVLGSWLAAAVGRRLAGRPLAGLVCGLVFSLHPLLWDASMTMLTAHLLMSCFTMLAFWAYLRGHGQAGRSPAWTALACAAYLLAALSKPPGAVFPALLLVYELAWGEPKTPWRVRLRGALRALIPYLACAAAFLIVFKLNHPGLEGVTSAGFSKGWTPLDPLRRMAAVAAGLLGAQHGPAVWGVLAALAAAAALSGRFLFFLGWSLVTLAPYLNLIPLEGLSRTMAMKDFQPRYALLAAAAFGWTAAAGLMRGLDRSGWPRRAAAGLLGLLSLAALLRLGSPLPKSSLPRAPLSQFLSLPFVRAADPPAYEALLAEAAARHGGRTAELFAEVSGSGLLYEDLDAAGLVRHIVYDLEFHPIFDPELPPAFLERLAALPAVQKDWRGAREFIGQGRLEAALPLLERALEAHPNHAQSLLAASGIAARQGRLDLARRLYAAARFETGLGHAALLALACGRMGGPCAELGLESPAYRDLVRGALDRDLDGPETSLRGLGPADRRLAFICGRAFSANGRFSEAERAITAALDIPGTQRLPRPLRAAMLLERAAVRLQIQDPAGAARDLEDVRLLAPPAWAGQDRWLKLWEDLPRP